ncbi:hypothetical protein PUN28_013759 [Cardiocondyla obscurior]|uniref:Secreted protein n=1 Tax=Cardiocondyla obscurior TaxID=286306 RepID=A0AAW2F519_9HYME
MCHDQTELRLRLACLSCLLRRALSSREAKLGRSKRTDSRVASISFIKLREKGKKKCIIISLLFQRLPISEETLDSYYVISIDHVESSRRCLVTKKYRREPAAKNIFLFCQHVSRAVSPICILMLHKRGTLSKDQLRSTISLFIVQRKINFVFFIFALRNPFPSRLPHYFHRSCGVKATTSSPTASRTSLQNAR